MKKNLFIPVILLLALLSNLTVVADTSQEQSIQLIESTCHTCHGPASNGAGAIPALNHLTAIEISQLLLDYKYDKKIVTIMNRIAKSLADEEINLLGKKIANNK